jgi:hypothetical protein
LLFKINREPIDYTTLNSDFNRIKNAILLEKEIEPQQIAKFKVDIHKAFIKTWIKDYNIKSPFEDIWMLREQCIANLSL